MKVVLGGTLTMENRRPRGLKQTIILTAQNSGASLPKEDERLKLDV
jgi:hypothetical protein